MGFPLCYMLVLGFISHGHSMVSQNALHRAKRYQTHAWSDPSDCGPRTKQSGVSTNSQNISVDIHMPGVIPTMSDSYLCVATAVPTNRDAYIVDFIPHASMNIVHHMLLFGCQTPVSTSGFWDCGSARTCEDEASIMYAWARNAPPTKLPNGVGFKVGRSSGVSYFVLQIHYADVSAFKDHHRDCSGLSLTMTPKPQPFIAGIYLLMSVDTVILPGKRETNADVACDYTSYPMYPFAFRTHTHHLGKVVSGYRIRDGKWSLIGRQSPQLPQAFYPANKEVNVKYGDTIAARCVFTGEGRTSKTYIGGTSDDEMCNFYIMYYMDRKHANAFMSCMETGSKERFQHIPAEANVPIAIGPENMNSMMHMGHTTDTKEDGSQRKKGEHVFDQGDFYSLLSKLLGNNKDVVHVHKYNPSKMQRAQADLDAQIDSITQNKDLGSPRASLTFPAREDPVLVRDRVHKFHQLEATARPLRSKLLTERQGGSRDYHFEQVPTWPQIPLQVGQVSGLALDLDGNLVIFHRGDHQWERYSFDKQGRFQQRSLGPIQQSTILVVDPVKGHILKASGRNMFYLPHGITTDADNNYWVTDVALHQVLKVSSDGRDRVLVTLGEAFTPGSDNKHFCQPTDVAVDTVTGNIFISDGYCNARILKFTADGEFITMWGAGSSDRRRQIPFSIPHSLLFLPDREEVCVADRENGRIQCFIGKSGQFVKEIKKEEFGGEVFAIAYSPAAGGLMYAVNGIFPYGRSSALKGFVLNFSTSDVVDVFRPEKQGFEMPHDIVVTKDGTVFVGDVEGSSIFKFTSEKEHRSVKKGGIEVQELEEFEAMIQTKLRPEHNVSKAVINEKQLQPSQPLKQTQTQTQVEAEKSQIKTTAQQKSMVFPAVMTTLLLIPLLLVISIGLFICLRKNNRFEVKAEPHTVGGIFGKLRGKTVGGLNLGNFFASHKGYSRQGFDQLSTEGSDQEKDDEESSDSEKEEYSAPPPPPVSSS
ncbi:peptidyl-glycine alpha-amidating monooxygenase isoform X3 [Genypterus blacodes]|uniref:peptidyl-glycine alpha-amidating monooxygenase isoform X3 n=1 Tax=Genypterus blacodes TaxID=154954 RepID=UPI003F75D063